MSRLYTPDGMVRSDINVKDNTGGGQTSFTVTSWDGIKQQKPVSTKEEFAAQALSPDTSGHVAGKTTAWDNSGAISFSSRGGKEARMEQIKGNDIFADVAPPILGKGRSHTNLKVKDMYGSVYESLHGENRPATADSSPVSGSTVFSTPATASNAKFSPGYATKRIADNKKRDLYGSDIFGTKGENGAVNDGARQKSTSFVVGGLDTIYSAGRPNQDRITGGGPVQIRLG